MQHVMDERPDRVIAGGDANPQADLDRPRSGGLLTLPDVLSRVPVGAAVADLVEAGTRRVELDVDGAAAVFPDHTGAGPGHQLAFRVDRRYSGKAEGFGVVSQAGALS